MNGTDHRTTTLSMNIALQRDAVRRLGYVLCETQSRCKNERTKNVKKIIKYDEEALIYKKKTKKKNTEGAMKLYYYGLVCKVSIN